MGHTARLLPSPLPDPLPSQQASVAPGLSHSCPVRVPDFDSSLSICEQDICSERVTCSVKICSLLWLSLGCSSRES